jgi:hypothetical protein
MTFSIRSIDIGNTLQGKCETIIGDHKEVVPLITTLWACDAYESQWMEALQALADESVNCCVLITDVQHPEDSTGVTYWAMYREGQDIYLQEQFSRDRTALLIGPASAVAPHIPTRIQGTLEEQSQVSEWMVPIDDLRQFVKNAVRRNS